MSKRFVSIWFGHLKTDWYIRRQPALQHVSFVLVSPQHGRVLVTAANARSQSEGVETGMLLADAKAIIPALQYFYDDAELACKLLKGFAEWFIRYTPIAAIDLADGLMLDVSGCAHLWGGEKTYLADIENRLKDFGYDISIAIADTIGAAWAMARFGNRENIIETGQQKNALLSLPPQALRIDAETVERLNKLGLLQISSFIGMPRSSLRRRFGPDILKRLDQALGYEEEAILPVIPMEPFRERLPCLEPIVTAGGIEIALERLLNTLCNRLHQEEQGLRKALFKCYRIDGKIEQIDIGTNRPSCNAKHLFKLLALKISSIEPALGIELFVLEATKTEDLLLVQEKLWNDTGSTDDIGLCELLDRIEVKTGPNHIRRYLPQEHYWPERSFKQASSINEKTNTVWKLDRPRPLQLLPKPEQIEVTAPIPDYPPMNFRYRNKLHKIIKADGPERIEQEWWLQEGQHRDYYCVENEEGHRYWLFRLGHYDLEKSYKWFMHGFFA